MEGRDGEKDANWTGSVKSTADYDGCYILAQVTKQPQMDVMSCVLTAFMSRCRN